MPMLNSAFSTNSALFGVKCATRGFDLFVSTVHSEEDSENTIKAFGICLDTMLGKNIK